MGQKGCRFSLFLFSPVQVGSTTVIQQTGGHSFKLNLPNRRLDRLSNAYAVLKDSRGYSKLGS